MLKELLKIHQDSLVNGQAPECLFAETLIFNEGWLLRSVLREWLVSPRSSQFGFLPFPAGVTVYSEGQLYTPFNPRFRGDKRAEGNTRVDGIVGNYSITDTKSGIVLKPDFRYVAVFEAKIYSPIGGGVTNAPYFDQVSRTTACLINSILQAGTQSGYSAHLAVLHAEDNRKIDPTVYSKTYIGDQITKRLQPFIGTDEPDEAIMRFDDGWKDVLQRLQMHFRTWEEVLEEIRSDELYEFYDLCKRFNA